MAAMIEFAVILFLQRQNQIVSRKKVINDAALLRRESFKMDELTAKIDLIALTLFSSGYIVFNVAYGQMYLI